jgi:hypothetical protein
VEEACSERERARFWQKHAKMEKEMMMIFAIAQKKLLLRKEMLVLQLANFLPVSYRNLVNIISQNPVHCVKKTFVLHSSENRSLTPLCIPMPLLCNPRPTTYLLIRL